MKTAWTAAAAVAMALVSASAGGQSLVDAAKRAEDNRKASTATPITFDERDVNPMLAAREVLGYEINEQRWKTFVTADNRVMAVMGKDPTLYGRLETLRANSARMIERFIAREPALLKALEAAGTDAHEFAYTSVAIGVALALIANDPGPTLFEQLPDATKTNIAFVRAHEAEIKELVARGERLKEKAAKLLAPTGGEAAPKPAVPIATEPSASAPKTAAKKSRLLSYRINDATWKRFLAADKLVIAAIEKDRRLYTRLKELNIFELEDEETALQVLQHLIAGEPALAKAVATVGSEPQEYASMQLVATIAGALAFGSPPAALLEKTPPAMKENVEFIRAHEQEFKELTARTMAMQERMEKK